ncbi:uncharacterized protein [Miscanthus floridulus]|uniref:uncharacterized protein n=1 Tax=Miscanthus floridulus TaxID=154761 RepID=UPI003457771A
MDPRNNSSSGRPPPFNDQRVQDLAVVSQPELLRAARSGDLPLLEKFLRKEDEVSSPRAALVEEAAPSAFCMPTSLEGASALHVVAASGDDQGYLDLARLICNKAPELLLACDGNGDTPLHCAVRAGNTGMVSLLIDQANGSGSDERKTMVRMQSKRGETALHEAVRCSYAYTTGLRMVKALIYVGRQRSSPVWLPGTAPRRCTWPCRCIVPLLLLS